MTEHNTIHFASDKTSDAQADDKPSHLAIEEWYETSFEITVRKLEAHGIRDPEDTVQAGAAKAFHTFDPAQGKLPWWIWRQIFSIKIDELRRRYRRGDSIPLDEVTEEPFVEPSPVADDGVECFRKVLKLLPAELVEMLLEHHGKDTAIAVLAKNCAVSEATMKMRLHRARVKLAAALRAAGYSSVADVEAFGDDLLTAYAA